MFGCVLALILVAAAAASVTTHVEESSILNQNFRNVITLYPSPFHSLNRQQRALKPEPKEKRKRPIVSGYPIFYGNKVFQKPVRN